MAQSKPSIDSLLRQLYAPDSDWPARADRVRDLASRACRSSRARRALVDRLQNDPHEYVRQQAIEEWEKLARPEALAPLLLALKTDPHRLNRGLAAKALAALGDRSATQPILAQLADRKNEGMARHYLIQALGALGDPRAAVPVAKALFDANDTTVFVASEALRTIPSTWTPTAGSGVDGACPRATTAAARPR